VELLERAGHLATLVDRFAHVADGGHLVLISGEAGAGKSALVEELVRRHGDSASVLIGRCDDLFAPRPLGPLSDIARARPGPLATALAAGDQGAAFEAFLSELVSPLQPVIVVLEDLQWADEATLDLLRFVARRLDTVPCLVLATHRDDLSVDHPLRRASGSLLGPRVSRIHLPPLTVDAVRTLVGDRAVDPESLHARTGGNPFFLIEVLAGEPGTLPATVRDAVLGRTTQLSGSARDALDAAAVLGRQVGADLIGVVGDCDEAAVDECVAAGLLVDADGHQRFRHELSRQAVEEAMTPLRRRQLHARALDALGADGDVVQRAHHAVGAGDREAILDLAWRAADDCVNLGAHSQAAALYGQALEHAEGLAPEERRRLLEARARTCMRVERVDDAIVAGEEALALIAAADDDDALGEWECWLSVAHRAAGRAAESRRYVQRAIDRLEPLGDSPGLARALSGVACLQLVSGEFAASIENGRRAQAMAEVFGLEQVAVYAMDMYGSAMSCLGDVDGIAVLRESIDRAKRADLPHDVVLACINLSGQYNGRGEHLHALAVLDEGIAVAEEHELRYRRNCLMLTRAEALTALGRWDEAAADATFVLAQPDLAESNMCFARWHMGRIRSRRGDPGAVEELDSGLSLALALDEAQLIVPIRLSRAEAAWFAADEARARQEVEASMALAHLLEQYLVRDVVFWARRVGVTWTPPPCSAEPIQHILAGDLRAVARFWEERGCRYDAADALGDSDDEADLREAYEQLTALGARPRAQQVARRLRDLGARDVPRGPRATTRANAAGLTAREVEVAGLLVEGLTNGAIAERLVLSPKTVDHHVSAVLTKLAVRNRREVGAAAAALGLDLQDGVPAVPR
jgi:ATP/maltotriose-dependent transcriptional regulator MalT